MKKFLPAMLLSAVFISSCGGYGNNQNNTYPTAAVAPSSLTFGTEEVGLTSQSLPVTLSNTGTAALNVSSIAASGGFASTDNCGASLAINASCTVSVTFTPGSSGALSGTLTIADNVTGSPQTVSLSGNGTVTSGGSCSAKGQQCSSGTPPLPPPCCSGLTCSAASTREFCE